MYVLIFFLSLVGFSFLGNCSPFDIIHFWAEQRRSLALRAVSTLRKPNRLQLVRDRSFWQKYLLKVDDLLNLPSNRWRPSTYWQLTICLIIIGGLLGGLVGNIYLSVVFAIGMMTMPYLYLLAGYYRYLKDMSSSLNLGMTLLTNDYLQSEDLIRSAEANYERLESPLKQIIIAFLTEVKVLNPDVKVAIKKMRYQVVDYYFKRWCDVMIQCQDDRDFKNILPAIIAEMADVRKQQIEYDLMMSQNLRSYWQLVLIAASGVPVLAAVNYDLAYYLINTVLGKMIVALIFAVLFGVSYIVISNNRPVSISGQS